MVKDSTTAKLGSEPVSGFALVAEGGGQRGVFTAGVLDSWLVANFNPFELLVGTSAGAQNIASYMSKQTGYAYSLIADLTRKNQFFSLWRLLFGKNAMDLDWYFSQVKKTKYLFDEASAQSNTQGRRVRFSASSPSRLATELIDPVTTGWLPAMKASSAIPYLYKSKHLIDGGVTAPVPVNEAHQLGATSIVAIRTTTAAENAVPRQIKQLKPIICSTGRCPNFIKYLDRHEGAYNKAERFINTPPKEVDVFEIRPHRKLASSVLGSSVADIVSDYKHGFERGQAFLTNSGFALRQQNILP